MSQNWSSWCRLCARIPCTESFLDTSQLATYFSELIQRCFQISHLEPLDNNPAKLCLTCIEFLTKLKAFDDTCSRSDKLFIDIVCDDSNRTDEELCSIRDAHLGPQIVRVQSLSCTEKEVDLNEKITEDSQRIKTEVDSGESNEINVENFSLIKCKSITKEPQLSEGTSEAQRPKNRKLNISHSSGETHYSNNSRKMVLKDEEMPCEFVPEDQQSEEDSDDDIIAPMLDNSKRSMITSKTKIKFVCKNCGKTYYNRPSLSRHNRVHTNRNEKVCPFCGIKYNRTDSLNLHIQRKHKQ